MPQGFNGPIAPQPMGPPEQTPGLLEALLKRWFTSQGPNGSAPNSPYAASLGKGAQPPQIPSMIAAQPGTALPPTPMGPPLPSPIGPRDLGPGGVLPGSMSPSMTGGAGFPPQLPPMRPVASHKQVDTNHSPGDIQLPSPRHANPGLSKVSTPASPEADVVGPSEIDPMLFNKTPVEEPSTVQSPLDSTALQQALMQGQLQPGSATGTQFAQVPHHNRFLGILKHFVGR